MESSRPLPHRRSIRLREYDYSQIGAYFITICAYQRRCLFGRIVDAQVRLNRIGTIVEEEWHRSTEVRTNVRLDAFVIMPNHVHGIVMIESEHVSIASISKTDTATLRLGPRPASLGSFAGGFKASVTRRVNNIEGEPGRPVWQRNYYEHIIRGETDLHAVREYIANNPANWENDRQNPNAIRLTRSSVAWQI